MGKILFTGAVIVSMDDNRPASFTGDLLIEEDRIAAISEHPGRVEADQGSRVIDGSRLILMPGLVNTHGHAAMSLFRGYADDIPLQEWLEQKIWPLEENLTGDDIYWGTLLSIAEMLKSGTTTFTDMYFFMDRAAEAAAEGKIRAVLSRGLVGIGEGAAVSLKESEDFMNNWHGAENGRINVTLGPHAPYTCPPDFLRRVIDVAERTRRPLQIHLSETAQEVADSLREHGCSPVQLVHKLGLFQFPVVAAHCVHLDDEDIAVLAEHGAGVAHNPGSNLKLGSGVAPVGKLLAAGVRVGLGTDGAASNNNLDMIEEMRLAALLAKGIDREPTRVPAGTALRMATADGAGVLGLAEVGRLQTGCKADLIALNREAPHMVPLHDPPAQLVYSAAAADVRLVMVDGEILVENGALVRLDEAKILAEAARCAKRLTGRSETA